VIYLEAYLLYDDLYLILNRCQSISNNTPARIDDEGEESKKKELARARSIIHVKVGRISTGE